MCPYLCCHSNKVAVLSAVNEGLIDSAGFHQHWGIKNVAIASRVIPLQCARALLALWSHNFGSSHSGFIHQDPDGFGSITTHFSSLDVRFPKTWHLLLAHLSWIAGQLSPGATRSYILESSNTEQKTSTNISSPWIIQLFHQLVSNPNVHKLHPNNLSGRAKPSLHALSRAHLRENCNWFNENFRSMKTGGRVKVFWISTCT